MQQPIIHITWPDMSMSSLKNSMKVIKLWQNFLNIFFQRDKWTVSLKNLEATPRILCVGLTLDVIRVLGKENVNNNIYAIQSDLYFPNSLVRDRGKQVSSTYLHSLHLIQADKSLWEWQTESLPPLSMPFSKENGKKSLFLKVIVAVIREQFLLGVTAKGLRRQYWLDNLVPARPSAPGSSALPRRGHNLLAGITSQLEEN